jgi:hypothetical protein
MIAELSVRYGRRLRTGNNEMKRVSAIGVAAALLGLAAIALKPVGAAVESNTRAEPKALERERAIAAESMLEAAKKTYGAIAFGNDAGTAAFADLYTWSRRWLEAAKSIAKSDQEQLAALREHRERVNRIHQQIAALHRAAAKGGEDEKFYATKYYLAEAELWLLEVGGKDPDLAQ